MSNDPSDKLEFNDSPEVPVFNCIVHLRPTADGYEGRVANLSGLKFSAASEREALSKIVQAFKQRIVDLRNQQQPIPWIEPPSIPEPDEQTRFIPVHL